MSFVLASRRLKALAEPTRLRLLALLAGGEVTVGELQAILGQSQPRVSRHLKLLADAGLVERFRDGHWVYYRLSGDPKARALSAAAIAQLPAADQQRLADQAALDQIKREREREVLADRPTLLRVRSLAAVPPERGGLETALAELLGESGLGDVLLAGCGSSELLSWLARRAQLLVGIDRERSARLLARSRAHETGLRNCTIRDVRLGDPGLRPRSFELVVLNEQLAGNPAPADTLDAALALLRPQGRLLIFDRVLPLRRQLDAAHGALADGQLSAMLAALGARVVARHWLPGRAPDYALISAAAAVSVARTGTND